MDPISALGVAANIIAFVDFGSKLFSAIYHSGKTAQHADLNYVVRDLRNISSDLTTSLHSIGHGKGPVHDEHEDLLRELAQQCQNICSETLDVLGKLFSKGERGTWNAVQAAIRTVWNQNRIDTLEKRLSHIRQELIISVLMSLRSVHAWIEPSRAVELSLTLFRADLKHLSNTQSQQHERTRQSQSLGTKYMLQLQDIKKNTAGWRNACDRWQKNLIEAIYSDDRDIEQRGGSLGSYINHDRGRIRGQFLEQLQFSGMQDRDNRVALAYKNTFKWIFNENSGSRVKFAKWLESNSQIYWITGKAGSGKSTLMKYIQSQNQTEDFLSRWAGATPLLTASFYLWNSGTQDQMSETGLLRSLLFQVVKKEPELLPQLFPERWEVASLFSFDQAEFTCSELQKALTRLCLDVKGFKICLFIDGLDECDGNHLDLANLIIGLTASPNIKVCVASRPWTVFEESFKEQPSLLLQDLTYRDIQHFVTSNFQKEVSFADFKKHNSVTAQKIIDGIVEKADGVFLWVQLVVRSMLTGLQNGDRAADLYSRLDELPQDLQNLYEKILQSLDPFYRKHAFQYFHLVKSHPQPLTLLDFSFADEEPEFVLTCNIEPLSDDEKRYRAESVRRRLNSRCKGLLEVSGEGSRTKMEFSDLTTTASDSASKDQSPQDEEHIAQACVATEETLLGTIGLLQEITDASKALLTVQYLHRTVKDYFEDETRWSLLIGPAPWEYDPSIVILRSFVSRFKTQDANTLTNHSFSSSTRIVTDQALCCEKNCSRSMFIEDYVKILQNFDSAAQVLASRAFNEPSCHWSQTSPMEDYYVKLIKPPGGSFLTMAVELGLTSFVKATLPSNCVDKQAYGEWPLLYSALYIFLGKEIRPGQYGPSLDSDCLMAQLLLARSADPNYQINNEFTIWQILVTRYFQRDLIENRYFEELIMLFIEYGARNPVEIKGFKSYFRSRSRSLPQNFEVWKPVFRKGTVFMQVHSRTHIKHNRRTLKRLSRLHRFVLDILLLRKTIKQF